MFLGCNLPRGAGMIPKECLCFQASFNSASTWQICPEPQGYARAGWQHQSDSSSSRKWSSFKRSPGEGYGDPKRERMQPVMGWNRGGLHWGGGIWACIGGVSSCYWRGTGCEKGLWYYGSLPLMGGREFCDDSFNRTLASIEKEEAFWLAVVHVDLRKERGDFWKMTIFITGKIRKLGKCLNFRDARKSS